MNTECMRVKRATGGKVSPTFSFLRLQVEFRKYGRSFEITMETLRRISDDSLRILLHLMLSQARRDQAAGYWGDRVLTTTRGNRRRQARVRR